MAVTKASQWQTVFEVELPSGYVAEIRPLGLDMVIRCNNMPDMITSLIVRAFKGEGVVLDIKQFEQAQDFVAFLDECCKLCFVHPQVVDAPEGEDQISPAMLHYADKSFVFGTLSQSPRWLDNFRPQQAQDGATGADEPALSPTTESVAEPEVALAG